MFAWKDKNEPKEAGDVPFLKKNIEYPNYQKHLMTVVE